MRANLPLLDNVDAVEAAVHHADERQALERLRLVQRVLTVVRHHIAQPARQSKREVSVAEMLIARRPGTWPPLKPEDRRGFAERDLDQRGSVKVRRAIAAHELFGRDQAGDTIQIVLGGPTNRIGEMPAAKQGLRRFVSGCRSVSA